MRLVLWQARRTLPALVVVAALVLLLLPGASASALGELAAPDRASAGHGALRALLVFGAFLLPVLLWRSASLGERWRARDVDWLGALPFSRARVTAGLLAGTGLSVIGLVLVGALLVTVPRTGPGESASLRLARPLPHPTALLLEGDAALRWELPAAGFEALPAGSVLALRPTVAPGSGPAVPLRFTLEDGAGRRVSRDARIHARTLVRLPLDAAVTGPARLTLERLGPGAVLALPSGSLELWRAEGGGALVRLAPWLEIGAAGVAWCLLGMALGLWMRASLAAGVAGALASVPLWIERGLPLWPGCGVRALGQHLERGLLPAGAWSTAATSLAACAVVASLAVLLTHAGLARGRGAV